MANLMPLPKMRFTNQGRPLIGGKVFFYVAGTSTPKNTFKERSQSTLNSNPVILDSNGEADIWFEVGYYKVVLKSSNDVVIWTVDGIAADAQGLNLDDLNAAVTASQAAAGEAAASATAAEESASRVDLGALDQAVLDAQAAAAIAVGAVSGSVNTFFAATKAAADTLAAGLGDGAVIIVDRDETNGNLRTRYTTASGAPVSPITMGTRGWSIPDIATLRTVAGIDGDVAQVTSYYDGWAATALGALGSGLFDWNPTSTDADDGGVTFAVVGVPIGRWKRRLGNRLEIVDFGAIPYASVAAAEAGTDSSDAVLNAIAFSSSGVDRPKVIYSHAGRYRIATPIPVDFSSIKFKGAGKNSTSWIIDHTDGEGVRFMMDNPRMEAMGILASASRAAVAKNKDLCGIRVEVEDVPDTPSKRTRDIEFLNVEVSNHPGSGIVCVGPSSGQFDSCSIARNKLHGYHIAKDVFTRVNETGVPGLCEIVAGNITDNGGHGVCTEPLTTTSSPAVRIGIVNVEINRNAHDATAILYPAILYLRGAQIEATRNVLVAPTGVTTMQGWFVSGVSIRLINNRYIGLAAAGTISCHDELPTRSVEVDGIQMLNAPAAFDPLVIVRKEGTIEPRGISVKNYSGGVVTRAVATDASIGVGGVQRCLGLTGSFVPTLFIKTSDQTVNNTTALVDVDDMQMQIAANEVIMFEATVAYQGDANADIRLRVSGPAGSTCKFAPSNSLKVGTDNLATAQQLEDSSNQIIAGAAVTPRIISLVGVCRNGSTQGVLRLRFAQSVATMADTTILADFTHIRFWRETR